MDARILATAVAVVLAVIAVPLAFGQREPDRPPNVSAESWIPINDRLGIVLMDSGAPPDVRINPGRDALLFTPPSGGYFMVKDGTGWRRLIVVEPLRGPGTSG
jgi:hypothetical protein